LVEFGIVNKYKVVGQFVRMESNGMKRKMKIVIAILVIIGISLLFGVIFASSLEMFILTENLQVEEFKPISDDSYAANILDGGVQVADIYIRAEHPAPQAIDAPVLVSIGHSEETELDSLFLKFSGTNYIQVYLEVPSGSWPSIHFQQTSDGKGVVFKVDDLGFQGTGTVTLQFRLTPFSEQQSFHFEAKFSMHKKAFIQLTRQEVWAYTDIPIPT